MRLAWLTSQVKRLATSVQWLSLSTRRMRVLKILALSLHMRSYAPPVSPNQSISCEMLRHKSRLDHSMGSFRRQTICVPAYIIQYWVEYAKSNVLGREFVCWKVDYLTYSSTTGLGQVELCGKYFNLGGGFSVQLCLWNSLRVFICLVATEGGCAGTHYGQR